MGTSRLSQKTSLLIGLVLLASTATMATIQVDLNGERLAFSVPPTQIKGRTMVPLRGIFEALGAEVRWDGPTQTITANKGTTNVQLGIGNPNAIVNTRTVILEAPAMILAGTTLVPLRFVSEALGANVSWNGAAQLIAISTTSTNSSPTASPTTTPTVISTNTIGLPKSTVIPVALDKNLSSATSTKGEAVTVTVRSTQDGDAEFPRGTKLNGIVSEVQKKTAEAPGVLALTFQEALLPDGLKVPITGSLISLDEKSVTQGADGHLVAKDTAATDTLKFIAIGTGAGLLIGKLTDKNVLTSGLIGAAAGYLYSTTTKDGTKTMDVTVKEGTAFGVRLEQPTQYNTTPTFAAARTAYLQTRASALK
jgi:hypothetical protein